MATLPEAIAQAVEHHRAGRLLQARQIYERVLELDSSHADAWQLLGLVEHQSGQSQLAVEHIERGISLGASRPEVLHNLGLAYQALKRWEQAATAFRAAAEQKPDYFDACHALGGALLQLGRWVEATEAYRRALAIRPDSANTHNNLGTALQQLGESDEALRAFERALEVMPGHADARGNLGAVLVSQKRYDEALPHLEQAERLGPPVPEVYSNLCAALESLGRTEEAIASGRRAVELNPNMAAAHGNLGVALKSRGDLAAAEQHFRRTIELDPSGLAGYTHLAAVLKDERRFAAAEAILRQALARHPDSAAAYTHLGNVLQEQARTDEARASFDRAFELDPSDTHRLKRALLMPPIVQSVDEIQRNRSALAQELAQLTEGSPAIEDPTTEVGMTAFPLAYHGLDDRPLQAALADVYRRASPVLNYIAPHCSQEGLGARGWGLGEESGSRHRSGKLRVGFLSKFFFNHPVTRHYGGLIKHLARDDFHVTLLRLPGPDDEAYRSLAAQVDRVVPLSQHLRAAQQTIADERLDAIVYTDLGMAPFTYFLAFSRLAPVQCLLPGHPDTTGIETIDYFFSCALMEAPGADQHYTERLVQFQHPPAFYELPPPATPARRSDFRLRDEVPLYLCAQTLFKIHPEFDHYLAAILEADRAGEIVMFSDPQLDWSRPLLERLRQTASEHTERIRFVPRQSLENFYQLLSLADVVLDTIHFNGGTTTLDALAMGAPVVTQPGQFLRGRTTFGWYQRMQLLDYVAPNRGEYVNLAVGLANDRDWNATARAKIAELRGVLYSDLGAVRELEEFLRTVIGRARAV